MVLQRDSASTKVWGTAAKQSSVTLQLSTAGALEPAITKHADASGKWVVELPAHAGSVTAEYTLRLTCGSGAGRTVGGSVVATGILFGDVFGCHGQSNMQFGLQQDFNSSNECATAHLHPHIRVFAHSNDQDWALPSNATVCQSGSRPTAAAARAFAPFPAGFDRGYVEEQRFRRYQSRALWYTHQHQGRVHTAAYTF